MIEQGLLYIVLLWIVTAAISAALAFLVWGRRSAPGAGTFTVIMLCLAVWSISHAFELLSVTLAAKVLWAKVMYLGAVIAPVAWVAFVLEYTQQGKWLTRRNLAWLTIVPTLTLLLVWTNEAHGLIWSSTWLQTQGALSILSVRHGLWFWIHSGYSYLLSALGAFLLVRAWIRTTPVYRAQMLGLLLGVLLPGIGAIVTAAFPTLGEIPLTVTLPISSLIMAWNLLRFHLFDLLPTAHGVVMAGMDDAVIIVNGQERVAYLNPAAERLTGCKASEVIGRPTAQAFSAYAQFMARYPTMADVRDELALGEGSARRYFDLHISGLRGRHGEPRGRLVVVHEITAYRQTQEQLTDINEELQRRNTELTSLYDAALELVSQLELPQLLHLIVERATDLMSGLSGGLYLYRPEHDELEYAVAYKVSEEFLGTRLKRGEGLSGKVLESGEPMVLEDYSTWPGRAAIYEKYHFGATIAVPLKWAGRISGVLNVVREAGRVFNEHEIRLLTLFANQAAVAIENANLYNTMQQELAERKRVEEALRQHASELQARSDELDTFAHTVAHDLRTPLTVVTTYLEMLEHYLAPQLDERQRGYLAVMARNAHKMNEIIEELLLLTSVRRVEVEARPLDMANIVTEALQRLAPMIESYQAEIVLPDAWPSALGHTPWVEEVWVNYLSNAIQFGGRPPRVVMGAMTQADGMVRFWVRDNGAGISPEDQTRLFVPFTRLNRTETKGHGLGLSIVRRIVEKLGGQVGLQSVVGQGSEFYFTLPQSKP